MAVRTCQVKLQRRYRYCSDVAVREDTVWRGTDACAFSKFEDVARAFWALTILVMGHFRFGSD